MTIDELVKTAHEMAKEKGWHEETRSALEVHALIHSEISEATEAARDGVAPWHHKTASGGWHTTPEDKPEGEAVELADAVIRIADYFGSRGWNLQAIIEDKMAYNATRPHRHGGKLY